MYTLFNSFVSRAGRGAGGGVSLLERLEKIIPLGLLFLCAVAIVLRVIGVLPHILASGELDMSRTIFVDAGIGGLLAVFAIVISLTLMGIQFASQEYTHRVMNTYLSSVMLWTMMLSYLFTVLYNLYMTAFLDTPVKSVFADVSIILQTLCLVLLVPHFVIAVFHLKPDYTINRILRSLNLTYLASIKPYLADGQSRVPHKVDRLLPAVEIIEKCIERGDRATVRVGLEDLLVCYHKFITRENEVWLSRYFLDYFLRLGREAVIEADDDSVVQVLEVFGEVGVSISSPAIASMAVSHIRNIGSTALKKEFDAAVEQMIDSLRQVALSTGSPDMFGRIFDTYSEITRQLFSQDKKVLILFFIRRLSEMGGALIERQDNAGLKRIVAVMEDIGQLAVTAKMRDVVHEVIQAYYGCGTKAARKEMDACDTAIESLVRIERQISKTDRELFSEVNFAKQEIEQSRVKHAAAAPEDTGIQTSDLW